MTSIFNIDFQLCTGENSSLFTLNGIVCGDGGEKWANVVGAGGEWRISMMCFARRSIAIVFEAPLGIITSAYFFDYAYNKLEITAF